MDEFIDELLHQERNCDIILPRIQKRHILEQNEELEPRVSALDDDLSEVESEEEEEEEAEISPRRKSMSPEQERDRDSRGREEGGGGRGREKERDRRRWVIV